MAEHNGKPEVRELNDGVSLWVQRKGEKVGEGRWRPLSTLDLLVLEWAQKGPALPVGSQVVRDVLWFS